MNRLLFTTFASKIKNYRRVVGHNSVCIKLEFNVMFVCLFFLIPIAECSSV